MSNPIACGQGRLRRHIRRFTVLSLSIVLLSGCAWAHSCRPEDLPHTSKIIRDVTLPGLTQTDQCGPQALAAVLRHQGDRVDLDDIVSACSSPTAATLLELSLIAKERGFETKMESGDPGVVRAAIDAGRPLMISVDNTPLRWINELLPFVRLKPLYHCFVVVGYDSVTGEVFFATTDSALLKARRNAFVARWRATNFAALLVVRKPGLVPSEARQ